MKTLSLTGGNRKRWLVAGVIVLLIAEVAWGGAQLLSAKCDVTRLSHLNPQIACGEQPPIDKKSYTAFRTTLNDYIAKRQEDGHVSEVAVYFRDLVFGPTFGVREYSQYSPASLLKLPMLLTYLSMAEDHPDLLATRVYYQGDPGQTEDLTQSISPKASIQPNTEYSLQELLTYMIKYSDNKAYYVLLEYLNQISPSTQPLRDTYIDLGIVDPRTPYEDTITVKSYSSIFVQLFNSSYFSEKATSEKALAMLTDTDFHDGLVAGVPAGIKIAHKFGERYDDATGMKQLHDCGIVYYPGNPYLLCVMTRGKDMPSLEQTIAEISAMVYKEFDSRKL